ncbi:NAD-dependent epimerase/dehydratase family protein [Candidatus Acetothermia bacterium]|jgi:UDP-glucose 4-epimerase|nr:NAD-dependent epimerase/dehydratase family protein [Candidatus Acetothermia bacterium]MCI2431451.1 NAD-dependent epimerase/dehydratase family protein [Candidatus Acetothermia bacterium]MCI2437129.1 NAD-dependent epimerase/dehydratase family protein [Candidatus Acetothermia bacterium]
MEILVTGGAGFVGSHVVDAYIAQGHRVLVVDDLSTGKRENVNPKANFYQIDITDFEELRRVFSQEKIDLINHHAAQIDPRLSVDDPRLDARINLIGLLNLLECCKEFSVHKIIFASSGGVLYGDAEKIPSPEESPKQPISPYGVAKLAGELYLFSAKHTHNLEYIALRYANVYGPRQPAKGDGNVVSTFARLLAKGQPVTIFGDGEQTRDFVFVGDVAQANLLATEKISELNRRPLRSLDDLAFNIGTGRETSVNQLFVKLRAQLKQQSEARYVTPRAGEVRRNALEITKAQRLLGFAPRVALDEGLYQTVRWVQRL